MNTDMARRIVRARTHLVLHQPFFGALALRLKCIQDETIETACTNGKVIRYNPEFIKGLTDEQVCGLIAHEVLHVCNGHIWRIGNRQLPPWNWACDAAINHHVLAAGLQLPPKGVPGENDSAEAIYSRLPTALIKKMKGNDPGGCGGIEGAPEEGQGGEGLEEEWKVATVQAAHLAKAHGKLPACAEKLLDDITNPPIDWRAFLADFVIQTARNDYDWSRPNQRHAGRGIILPGVRSNELPPIVIGTDTSGSLWDSKHQGMFAGAISDILEPYPTTAHVIECDAKVQRVREYSSDELPIELGALKGGGGTDFRPMFNWVDEHGIEPACMVILTDLQGDFPDTAPDYPVLWVSVCKGEAPFGETVHITEED